MIRIFILFIAVSSLLAFPCANAGSTKPTVLSCPPGSTLIQQSCATDTDAACDPSIVDGKYVVDATGLPTAAPANSDACFDAKKAPHIPKCSNSSAKLVSLPGHDKCRVLTPAVSK